MRKEGQTDRQIDRHEDQIKSINRKVKNRQTDNMSLQRANKSNHTMRDGDDLSIEMDSTNEGLIR